MDTPAAIDPRLLALGYGLALLLTALLTLRAYRCGHSWRSARVQLPASLCWFLLVALPLLVG